MSSLELRLADRTVTDALAREASSHVRVSPEIEEAVACYKAAAAVFDLLYDRPADTLSPAEFDAFRNAQQLVAEMLGVLADAGMLHLIEDV
ncbi:hypothetical protein [Streptomyces sp. NPDC058268]|uniref:hypothetical protein n=1 Tax=Streptomyces sp. NPDC058268 TaxID=3346413 RepID=UPI0036ED0230